MSAACFDCGRPYDDDGFQDLVIPHDEWRCISPTGDSGGLLCACCMCARLTKAGIRCKGAFMSGPVETVRREGLEVRPASVDTHPKDGDVKQAPLVSGAVAKPDAQGTSA